MRSRHAARKRAPKSLNALVGPWNSSSTDSGAGAFGRPTSGAGKVERLLADRRQLGRERIAGGERRQQRRGDLRQLDVGLELPRREMRKLLGNVQPAVRRDAARNGFAELHSVVGVAGADVVHGEGLEGQATLSFENARAGRI